MKLVARSGIGTTAAVSSLGVKADVILTSGHVGGTGAAPHTSIRSAPAFPGKSGLPRRIRCQTLNRSAGTVCDWCSDGGLKTGRRRHRGPYCAEGIWHR